MITHPESIIPADQRAAAYARLLETLAKDEPEALRRAAVTLDQNPTADGREADPAARLASAWLVFAGEEAPARDETRGFTFTYPAHVTFSVSAGSAPAAKRIARSSISALLGSDQPVGAIHGPYPDTPALHDMVLWLGSPSERNDVLELELTDR